MIQALTYNGKLYHVVSKKSPLIGSQTYLTITEEGTDKKLTLKGIRNSPRAVLYKVEALSKAQKRKIDEQEQELQERFQDSIQLYEHNNPQPEQYYKEITLNPL